MRSVPAIDGERMRHNFSARAGEYDRYARVQKRVVADLVQRISGLGPLSGPALDIGTGTGCCAAKLCEPLPRRAVTVMDLAHGMTRQASQRLSGVNACDGDAGRLPFRSAAFQTVVSSSVYQWIPRLPEAFGEVQRVLRPGGLFAVALFGEQTLYELRSSHQHAVASSQKRVPSHVHSFPSSGDVREALLTAGVECREMITYLDVDYHASVADLLRELKQIGASNAAENRPRGLASRRLMQKMMRFYEMEFREGGRFPATYEVIVALSEKVST